MATQEWEDTYLKIIRVVANTKKLLKTMATWNPKKEARILDLCCGNAACLSALKTAGYNNVFGLDLSLNLLSIADNRTCLVNADATATPFTANAFDVVLVHKALHHFIDHRPLIMEIVRVLKPNGHFCFLEPRNTWFRKLYHAFLMSTVSEIFPPLKRVRKAALIEEGSTYFPWLNNSHEFFSMLEDEFDFHIESLSGDLIHYAVKCKSNKTT